MDVNLFTMQDRIEMREDTFFGSVQRLRFALLKAKQTFYKEHNCILAWLLTRAMMKDLNRKLKPTIMKTWNENDEFLKNQKHE